MQVILDAQAGDTAAFERLAARWHPRLLRYAARLTGDADGAREVTQETWMAVTKGLRRLRDPASFAAWALRVTARRSADWIQARRRTRRRDAAADPNAATAGERAGRPEDVLRVREALARLPAAARALVTMHYAQGLSVEEMAAVLGVPPGTRGHGVLRSDVAKELGAAGFAVGREIPDWGGRDFLVMVRATG